MGTKDLKKLKNDLYWQTKTQRKKAWYQKDYKSSIKMREQEQETFEKWKLLDGLLKAQDKQEKERENDKTKIVKNERK